MRQKSTSVPLAILLFSVCYALQLEGSWARFDKFLFGATFPTGAHKRINFQHQFNLFCLHVLPLKERVGYKRLSSQVLKSGCYGTKLWSVASQIVTSSRRTRKRNEVTEFIIISDPRVLLPIYTVAFTTKYNGSISPAILPAKYAYSLLLLICKQEANPLPTRPPSQAGARTETVNN